MTSSPGSMSISQHNGTAERMGLSPNQPSLFKRGVQLRMVREVPLPTICLTDRGTVGGASLRSVLCKIDDCIGGNASWRISIGHLAEKTNLSPSTIRRAVTALSTDAVALTLVCQRAISAACFKELLGDQGPELIAVTKQYKGRLGRSASEFQILYGTLGALIVAATTTQTKAAVVATAREVVALMAAGSGHGARGSGHGGHSPPAPFPPKLPAPYFGDGDDARNTVAWKVAEEEFKRAGVKNWRGLANLARRKMAPSRAMAIAARALQNAGEFDGGALYVRIDNDLPEWTIDEGWPHAKPEFLAAQRRRASQQEKAARDQALVGARAEMARRSEVTLDARRRREETFGPVLDRMSSSDVDELAKGLHPTLLPLYSREEPTRVRDDLLKLLQAGRPPPPEQEMAG
jgi:hypothetical protein